ncbi:N-acetyltransferase [Corallincola luteus]|uniref:N-acetyltransferase n=1 Tax=Corallincola luteus TaxID=1775177 RepID=A0ABY2AGG6_9GAMM|nr:GNAT family N-acetyltransferase [Corallincola luteus]TCI01641.1 N-acetyltransferase [Corallincola luteus]
MAQIWLRDVLSSDMDTLFEQQNEPKACEVAQFVPRSREAFLSHWQSNVLSNTCATVKTVMVLDATDVARGDKGRVAGSVVCWLQQEQWKIGYWLGCDFWQRGIATQALSLFLDVVIERPLYANVTKSNIGSLRVLAKNGFIVEREQRFFCPGLNQQIEELVLCLPATGSA